MKQRNLPKPRWQPANLLYCTSDYASFTDEQSAYNHAILLKDDSVITMTKAELQKARLRLTKQAA